MRICQRCGKAQIYKHGIGWFCPVYNCEKEAMREAMDAIFGNAR